MKYRNMLAFTLFYVFYLNQSTQPFVKVNARFHDPGLVEVQVECQGVLNWAFFDSGSVLSHLYIGSAGSTVGTPKIRFKSGAHIAEINAGPSVLHKPLSLESYHVAKMGLDLMKGGQFFVDYQSKQMLSRYESKQPFNAGLNQCLSELRIKPNLTRMLVLPLIKDKIGFYKAQIIVNGSPLQYAVASGANGTFAPSGALTEMIGRLRPGHLDPTVNDGLFLANISVGKQFVFPTAMLENTDSTWPGVLSLSQFANGWAYLDFVNSKVVFELIDDSNLIANGVGLALGGLRTKSVNGNLYLSVTKDSNSNEVWGRVDNIGTKSWQEVLRLFRASVASPAVRRKLMSVCKSWSTLSLIKYVRNGKTSVYKITPMLGMESKGDPARHVPYPAPAGFYWQWEGRYVLHPIPPTTPPSPGYHWKYYPGAGWCEVPN